MRGSAVDHIPAWGWLAFGILVLLLLAIDLLAHRGQRASSRRNAILWSIIWVAAGLLVNVFVWVVFGGQAAYQYLAAYLIEKSLSLDNLFVFLVVFQSLDIPPQHQHRVLFWGIFGALVFRGLFIFIGTAALERWEWISYIFGAILFYAAYRTFREDPAKQEENTTVAWLSKHLPLTEDVHGKEFIARQDGRRVATPLLVALIAIELTDIMFAIDSVPAAFSVSRSPFIVYSSNVFAILGLRALYVVLAHAIAELKYLHYGLAGVLGFAGVKLIIDQWVHVSPLISVGIIVAVLGTAVWASLRERKEESASGRHLSI
jgi:tellurite resistance protein TerC